MFCSQKSVDNISSDAKRGVPTVSIMLFDTKNQLEIVSTNKVIKLENGRCQSILTVKPSVDRNTSVIKMIVDGNKAFVLENIEVKKKL